MAEKEHNNKIKSIAQGKKKGVAAKQIHFKCIDSTNTWAKEHPDQWALEGVTVVTASEQTAGRGRFKRTWLSPADVNLYATFCSWFDPQRTDVGHIPQLLALAAAMIVEKMGFFPKIKWPNDLLLNGKKVSGILCETTMEEERRGVICGIGLNVNMREEELRQIDRPATSLFVEGGEELQLEPLLHALTDKFISLMEEFDRVGFSPFFPHIDERSFFRRGEEVRFYDHTGVVEGTFDGFQLDGSVNMRLPNGINRNFYAGEFI